jgi:hypothetical protein
MKRRREGTAFALLRLPDDLLLQCVSLAVEEYSQVQKISRTCRVLQQLILTTPGLFGHIHLWTSRNAKKQTAVYRFWPYVIADADALPALSLFRAGLKTISLPRNVSICALTELSQAPLLRELKVQECDLSLLVTALPWFGHLQKLCLSTHDIETELAAVIPLSLTDLSARHISGAHQLPVLPDLENLRLGSYCDNPAILSNQCPNVLSLFIQCYEPEEQLMDFSSFRNLLELELRAHGCYQVPSTLEFLTTFHSNKLIGPVPAALQCLTMNSTFRFSADIGQLDKLCSAPSLEYLCTTDIKPSTLERLAALPKFNELRIDCEDRKLVINLLQFPLRHLQALSINNCVDPHIFPQLSTLQSLTDLTISDSSVRHEVVHHLLQTLTKLKILNLWDCNTVKAYRLRKEFPNVFIDTIHE